MEQFLEIMHTRSLGESLDPYLPIVEKSIARLQQMRELITDVVDWAKIQSPSSRTLVQTDLSAAAQALLNGLQRDSAQCRISITAEIEKGLIVSAAPREIELILRHLLCNAVKFNRAGGSVSLVVKQAGSHIAVSVSDTGIGMTEEDQARIFQEFVRIKDSKTQGIAGTGLGLAIVRKLVELYGGNISVQSEPDRGTTVSLSIPCTK